MEEYRKGLLLAFATALISGVSVFVNGAAVKLSDPFVYTALKNIGALAFLAALVFAWRELSYFRSLSRRQWGMLALIGIIGGSVPFLMFFYGLKLGGAAASSFIYRSLFLFAGVFGYFILKEKPDRRDFLGALLILAGNALLVSGSFELGAGPLLVLGATLLWALEYTLSRKALSSIQPRAVMVSRMLFGSLVLLGFLAYEGTLGSLFSLTSEMLVWLGVASLLLFGFLATWYTSLKYLPVFRATAILALGGLVTAALDLFFSSKALALSDALGLVLLLIGVFAIAGVSELARALRRSGRPSPGPVE
ncbi:MAG TPA: DMT family transporter [Candidatus Bilamarchaeum sp.]|nr:DMT family transporter [Candidatus Bilamarchaeum sp.]